MKTPKFSRSISVLMIVLGTRGVVISTQAQPVLDRPVAVLATDEAGSVDLFVMRLLEYTLATWQAPTSDMATRDAWLSDTEQLLEMVQVVADEDCDVVASRACNRVREFLANYKSTLNDEAIINHISDVAQIVSKEPDRSDQAANMVSTGATLGGGIGTIAGTIFPGFGNIVGGATGTIVGGAIGGGLAATWLDDADAELRKRKIDDATRVRILNVYKRLHSEYEAVYGALQSESAPRLANRFEWGATVGYDDSMTLPYADQVKLRPMDPFVRIQHAISISRTSPIDAAKAFFEAAKLVPQDSPNGGRLFTDYRSALFLSAARAAEYAASQRGYDSSDAANLAVSMFEAARSELGDRAHEVTPDAMLGHARSLAVLGRIKQADEVLESVRQRVGDDNPFFLYEVACINSQLGRTDLALAALQKSFQRFPRVDRNVLNDPALQNLVSSRRAEIEMLCSPAIVGGTWETPSGRTLEFYPDGSVRQVDKGKTTIGTFTILGRDALRLKGPSRDFEVTYSVENDSLSLGGEAYSRRASHVFGVFTDASGREFSIGRDGTWYHDTAAGRVQGRWAAVSSANSVESALWFSRDHPLAGRRHVIRSLDKPRETER